MEENSKLTNDIEIRAYNPLYISPSISGEKREIEIFSNASHFAESAIENIEHKYKTDPYLVHSSRRIITTFTVLLSVTKPILDGRQPTPVDILNLIADFSKVKRYQDAFEEHCKELDGWMADAYVNILEYLKHDITGDKAETTKEHAKALRDMAKTYLATQA